jgi:hypothetical protein
MGFYDPAFTDKRYRVLWRIQDHPWQGLCSTELPQMKRVWFRPVSSRFDPRAGQSSRSLGDGYQQPNKPESCSRLWNPVRYRQGPNVKMPQQDTCPSCHRPQLLLFHYPLSKPQNLPLSPSNPSRSSAGRSLIFHDFLPRGARRQSPKHKSRTPS